MFETIRFKKPDPVSPLEKLLVVEVPLLDRPEPITPELRESLTTLKFHPGFNYIMKRYRFQRAVLEAKLKTERHETLRDAEVLQVGISWMNWIEQQINVEIQKTAPVPAQPTNYEQVLFDQSRAALHVIE